MSFFGPFDPIFFHWPFFCPSSFFFSELLILHEKKLEDTVLRFLILNDSVKNRDEKKNWHWYSIAGTDMVLMALTDHALHWFGTDCHSASSCSQHLKKKQILKSQEISEIHSLPTPPPPLLLPPRPPPPPQPPPTSPPPPSPLLPLPLPKVTNLKLKLSDVFNISVSCFRWDHGMNFSRPCRSSDSIRLLKLFYSAS